jgi:UDP-glucose 4-epimerase
MRKILITGVAGFIGSHVAQRFIQEGFRVIGVDDLSGGKMENVPPEVDFIQGDLSLTATMDTLPDECHKVLHLAGQSSGEISFDDPIADLNKNTVSTLNLIHYGIANSIERIVYASSMSVYGSVGDRPTEENSPCLPLSCYGIGKLAAENYLRVYFNKLPFVSLRMFNVYGPGQDMKNLRQGMVSIYLAQALEKRKIVVKGSLNRFRDFIYIDDVVETWFRATTYPSALGQTLNVGTGIKTTVKDILERICTRVPGSSYHVHGSTEGDQSGIYADASKLGKYLNQSQFIQLEEGLSIFANWAHGYVPENIISSKQ